MQLRLATSDDLADIARLGRLMHQESSFAPLDYDVDRVKETIGCLIDKNQFVVVVEGTNGEIVGGMAGMVEQSWFGGDMIANDLALFLDPAVRGGRLAFRLVAAWITWAKMAGAKQLRPGVVSGSKAAEEMYERMGFQKTGATFCMKGV